MQKLVACSLLAILLISALNNPVYADDAIDKLVRGVINVIVSPLEFFQGIGDAFSEHDIAVAWPVGLFNATWKTVRRAGVGIFEIVTFPFPQPGNYGPIIEEPSFLEREKQEAEQEIEKEELPTSIPEESTSDEEFPFPIPGI